MPSPAQPGIDRAPAPAATTVIRNAAIAILWDGTAHHYATDCDIAFSGGRITHVGPRYDGPADIEVDGRDRLVMPGLIDAHTHPATEPGFKGIREEHGVPRMGNSGLYERSLAFRLDEDGRRAAQEVAYAEMLASGVTSVVDLTAPFPGWVETAAASGLRSFLAPGFRSAAWRLEGDFELKFDWDEAAGRRDFEAALRIVDALPQHPSGRLSGVLYPAQIETVSLDLMKDSIAAARERNIPLTTHVAQSMSEIAEVEARHGTTPLGFAEDIGLLGPDILIAHVIFIDEHSWIRKEPARDLARLVDSGTSVVHCPTPVQRYGHQLENFGRYAKAGVNMCIGTDVSPHNMIEEMRSALIMARVAASDITATDTAEVFTAATVGGARAMMRDDLGKLAVGARADIVLVDLEHPDMIPARDPLRSLVYTAAERAVRDVFVDGHHVVQAGVVTTLDRQGATQRLDAAQRRMLAAVPTHDFRGRSAEEIAPLSLPMRP